MINAFMGNPGIVILDEPTSGLVPLMQNRFIVLIIDYRRKKERDNHFYVLPFI
ncbi:MAG: hypothetical protein ACLRWN_30150 [Eisenbergiella sp.]|nr:hypothetical protein [Eisenbergiella sp. OF01-20]BDF47966.1 hypothetical protein CE91St56_50890 [Lachnospiraceae bacterium]GKH44042.1 hypothetical protein CE91St57_50160 [Lachnospiraceae bacterium]